MAISLQNIDSFHDFAAEQLANGGQEESLENLLSRWRAQQGEAETLASVQLGIEDADAGRVHSLQEVDGGPFGDKSSSYRLKGCKFLKPPAQDACPPFAVRTSGLVGRLRILLAETVLVAFTQSPQTMLRFQVAQNSPELVTDS